MPNDPNYYAILGLKPGSSAEEVKRQYRRLAKVYHPDRNNNDQWCQEQIKRINIAYEYLLDPSRKASYDARFQIARGRGETASPEQSPVGWHPYADRTPNRSARTRAQPPVTSQPYPNPDAPRFLLKQGRVILGIVSVSILISLLVFFSMDISSIGGFTTSQQVSSNTAKGTAPMVSAPSSQPAPEITEDRFLNAKAADKPLPAVSTVITRPAKETDATAPLLARCRIILSKVDALISQGENPIRPRRSDTAAYSAGSSDLDRNAVMTRLDNDLSLMKSQRELLGVDIALLQSAQGRDDKFRASQPLQTDLQSLETLMQPLQADLQTLKDIRPSRVAVLMRPTTTARIAVRRAPGRRIAVAAPTRQPAPQTVPTSRPVVQTPHISRRPAPNPHLSSPASEEPQFSMPSVPGAGSSPREPGTR